MTKAHASNKQMEQLECDAVSVPTSLNVIWPMPWTEKRRGGQTYCDNDDYDDEDDNYDDDVDVMLPF